MMTKIFRCRKWSCALLVMAIFSAMVVSNINVQKEYASLKVHEVKHDYIQKKLAPSSLRPAPAVRHAALKAENGTNKKGVLIYEYEKNPTGITITGCAEEYSKEQSLTIPGDIDGKPVTEIGYCVFLDYTKLKEIVIPDTVTRIDDMAFAFCGSLERIVLPRDLKSIGEAAFMECGLQSVSLPNGLETIESYAFHRSKKLQSVEIPDSVVNIGQDAFTGCTSLASVSIPSDWISEERIFPRNCIIQRNEQPHADRSLKEVCVGTIQGKWEKAEINGRNCGMLHLDTPIEGMTRMTVDVDISMKSGARSRDWDLCFWNGKSWEILGRFCLPEGEGSASVTVYGDGRLKIEQIAAVPKAVGSYSWDRDMVISDAWQKKIIDSE